MKCAQAQQFASPLAQRLGCGRQFCPQSLFACAEIKERFYNSSKQSQSRAYAGAYAACFPKFPKQVLLLAYAVQGFPRARPSHDTALDWHAKEGLGSCSNGYKGTQHDKQNHFSGSPWSPILTRVATQLRILFVIVQQPKFWNRIRSTGRLPRGL